MLGLSPVAVSGGHSSLWCTGLSLSQPLLLWSTGPRHAGSVVVAHGPSCSVACGILPDQGPNPCPLHWQADSQPLHHQGNPLFYFIHISLYLLIVYPYLAPPHSLPPVVTTSLFSISVTIFLFHYIHSFTCFIF